MARGRSKGKMLKVTVIDKGMREILRKAEADARKGVQVFDVGVDDPSVAEYAAANEFGTERIPARSFMRAPFDANKKTYAQQLTRRALRISDPNGAGPASLRETADDYQRDVVAAIDNYRTPPNTESTAKAKAGNAPLKDSGKLRRSIVVVEGER